MNNSSHIDLRNLCEPTLSMRLRYELNNAEINESKKFLTNDPLVFRQVSIICKQEGHQWRVDESNKKNRYFRVRIGKPSLKQKAAKHKLLLAALSI